jgi:hypothetical protein
MQEWDAEFLDAEREAFIRFEPGGGGEFHFGCVHGLMDYRLTKRDAQPAAEWTWEGNDEHDPAFGRGWAVIREDGTLSGMIFFHEGEESGFLAKRA